jgi:nucleotide-binding universal stress UspA family protein
MTLQLFEDLVEKTGANLIVMGMRKYTGEGYPVSGITSDIIIKNTKVPVLVVPEQVAMKLPERVLYACDYQALPKEEHLNVLKDMAKAFGSELQVFHVYQNEALKETEQELKKSILDEIESAMSSVDHTYRDMRAKDFVEGLKTGIRDFNADILVMSPHKYGFWTSLIHKSKTREMVLKSEIPLLCIPS